MFHLAGVFNKQSFSPATRHSSRFVLDVSRELPKVFT